LLCGLTRHASTESLAVYQSLAVMSWMRPALPRRTVSNVLNVEWERLTDDDVMKCEDPRDE